MHSEWQRDYRKGVWSGKFQLWKRGVRATGSASKLNHSSYSGVSAHPKQKEKQWYSNAKKPGAKKQICLGHFHTEEDAARAHDSFLLSYWNRKTQYSRNINFSVRLMIAFGSTTDSLDDSSEDDAVDDIGYFNLEKKEYEVRDHHSIFGQLIAVPVNAVTNEYKMFDPSKVDWEYHASCKTGLIEIQIIKGLSA
jgi:hypothetical protein